MNLPLELSRALQARDLDTFEKVLKLEANANEPDSTGITIYEKALATAGCREFIRLCLQYGCRANYINQKRKAAVNFASDSRDSGNLKVLLYQEPLEVNHKFNGLTPLNSLAKGLKAENASEVTKCIKLLLEKGASPNIADDQEMRPLNYVISSKIDPRIKQVLVDLFLAQPDIYLDEEMRTDLLAGNPQLKLPPSRLTTLAEQLIGALRNGDEQHFCQLLGNFKGNCSDLYKECIANGHHACLDCLLQHRPNVDGKIFVEFAIADGNWYALDKLLQKWEMPEDAELLISIICKLDEQPQRSFSDFTKCFDVLLASGRVNWNMQDSSDRTPLHYATLYNHEYAVQQLLRHGASLNIGSVFTEMAIESIDPELLEEHFDDCITSNGKSRAAADFKVTLNYKTFQKPNESRSSWKAYSSEMNAIRAIGQSKTHRHLLNHPLITSLLVSLQWQNIRNQYYIYFLFSVLLSVIIAVNVLFIYSPNIPGIVAFTFKGLSWFSVVYLTIVEFIMALLLRCLHPMSRIMNIALVVLAALSNFLGDPDPPHYHTRIIAAFTIILVGVRLTALIGSLPLSFLSLYVLMLREVCYTFLKSCLPHSILVGAFGLSFYLLNFHGLFEQPIVNAVIKTIIMSTGEFGEDSIEYKNLLFARIFFITFVLFISIVVMNLLSALAFSDIQAIQAAAEVRSLNSLVDLLIFYDMYLDQCKPLRKILEGVGQIKSTKIPELVVTYPNDKNITKTATAGFELQPLIQGNTRSEHKINIQTEPFVIHFNKLTIKRIHKLFEKKSKRNI
ncbi:hypothetical protein KR044_012347 [Drosophila immigrans]|nr:hypothetical protein KR044_012347 [Drosophila immigrans]